jgi:acetyl-CoA carboxylase biotin carboxyl carrier protein
VELTNDDVRDILQVLDGLPYDELHLETARFRLSLRRQADGAWTQATEVLGAANVLDAAVPAAIATGPADPVEADGQRPQPPPAAADPDLADVRAPLLGTFYRAPRPGAAPFVSVGSTVQPDTVVCIIETMKLMNSVTAGVSGSVAEILLANAQFAEQGTVLMRIRERPGGTRS